MENNLENLTIGVFAKAAGVNVETIRFYQRKGLLREPDKPYGSIRRYGEADVVRVKFVKSAQRLGFSLDEIAELLRLDDGTHCEEASSLAEHKLKDVREKEACGGSHFMARKLEELGHFPKLISPQFVRPFVKSNKNDFVDAEAICEAASRPSMRFVQPRTESQQAMRALHRVRESLVQDKVKTTNQMHAFLLEFGISVPRGAAVISRLSTLLEDSSLPLYLSQLLLKLQQHYHYLVEQIKDLESQLKRKLDEDEVGQRLLSIPCVGTLTASTISTEIGDGKQYASSRDFAAATGLVPRQYSTGGRTTLLGISKRGNKKIRTLLVQCARVFIQKLEHQSGKLADWVRELLCRKSNFVVTCALANKLARIAWALTARQQTYEA
ncbi:IS110 family transposase [Escherichia coli]|nr:IS110 family transposase [Escherichia coli]MDT9120488.1 IS110 family transposase [Escherichia coli]